MNNSYIINAEAFRCILLDFDFSETTLYIDHLDSNIYIDQKNLVFAIISDHTQTLFEIE